MNSNPYDSPQSTSVHTVSNRRVFASSFKLAVGISLSSMGVIAIGFDILTKIAQMNNTNPKHKAVTTFPTGTFVGAMLALFGCHLIFGALRTMFGTTSKK